MKTIKLELTLTLCAIVALCGCVKDRQNVKSTAESADGSRVIAVSFCPSTKTILDNDGLTPKFQEGDAILVANGKAVAECKVVIENDIAVIHTDLEGELDAVYPASAAENDGCTIYGIRVAPTQTGKFADANICRAKIAANSNSATFSNQTAVLKFYVDATIGVQSITIESQDSIATDSGSILIDFNDKSSILSDIGNGSSNERICYVAAKARTYTDLHFSSKTSTQASTVTKELTKVTLETGKMYNVFLPYYIEVNIGTTEEPNIQKWAYCNIGAFLPEEKGFFFTWGNKDGHWLNGNTDSYVFSSEAYNGTPGSQIPSGESIDPASDNDVAHANWGGNWRMPTFSELGSLFGSSSFTEKGISGEKGYYCFDGKIFLPAACCQEGSEWSESVICQLWSADSDNKGDGASWVGREPDTNISGETEKYYGMPIRPIYDDSALDAQD